jgi:glycine/D-amino acid oxidase-like deaminating enzyme
VVVNAAGPYARQVAALAGIDVPVQPFRRHIFIAQANDEQGRWAIPASHVMVIDFESTFYFHREGAGLLFGMGDPNEPSTFDTTVQWDFLPQVIDVAVTRLPALAEASISHAWAGLYEMSPDGNPIIGAAPPIEGLFLINGFSGHGFQHSPAAGRILADVIAGRDPQFDLTPFALDRFAHATVGGERYVV